MSVQIGRLLVYCRRLSNLCLLHETGVYTSCARSGSLRHRSIWTLASATHFQRKFHSSTPVAYCANNVVDASITSDVFDSDEDALLSDVKYLEHLREYHNIPDAGHRVFVLLPEAKSGPRRSVITTPQLKLAEACALIGTLRNWTVVDTKIVKTKQLSTRFMFGSGTFREICELIASTRGITAVFVSVDLLTTNQITTLQSIWKLPVFDRYTIVIQIFKDHARTKEAKLQVALAEIPHLRTRLQSFQDGTSDKQIGGPNFLGGSGETHMQIRRQHLMDREGKLKKALNKLKKQRSIIRSNRVKKKIPVVAIVGYTNAGKTTLIKALTGDRTMEPMDQLFATLDITAHAGQLPSHMTVLFMDTVGFIADIPFSLIDAFSATLEDAVIADVIVHIRDISHPDTAAQKHNVIKTLNTMLKEEQMNTMIEVCNKCDLLSASPEEESSSINISALTGEGLARLREEIEARVIVNTGRLFKQFKLPLSGQQLSWLYKEATVTSVTPDVDSEYAIVQAILTKMAYDKFKAAFGKTRKLNTDDNAR